ncbi:MAG: hypothetical protein H0T92_07585 [Pyrinomonadaceae bacterium]|nr:hypothetical protein [Pyrinomonadaceae bacterium]
MQTALATLVLLAANVCTQAQGEQATKANGRPAEIKQATASLGEGNSATESAVRYTYEFAQPEFYVRHIVVEHDGAGRGKVSFERKADRETLTDPLELSPTALGRITALWNALRFLESNTNYQSSKQFPHLGTMRLAMRGGGRERIAEFNWTKDPDASALVNEYRRIVDQALFVFDIALARQNQPLETPKILKRLDTLLARGALSDPQQLIPLLGDIQTDERLPLIARNHAGRLLKKLNK